MSCYDEARSVTDGWQHPLVQHSFEAAVQVQVVSVDIVLGQARSDSHISLLLHGQVQPVTV